MFIVGLSLFSVSSLAAVYLYMYGSNDDSTGVIFYLSCFIAMIGIVLMVFARMKRKNSAELDSIQNNNKVDYCPKCNVNVSGQNGQCPLCGTNLRKR